MKPILVLGIGSRLMMDDGVGVYVVETLAKQCVDDPWVAYEVGETDVEYCLDLMQRADYLIVIDATKLGKPPGEWSTFQLREHMSRRPGISQHNLHFLEVMQQMDRGKKGVIIGIEPFQVDFHWGLSKELSEHFDRIVREVKDTVERVKIDYIKDKPKPAR